MSADVQNHTRQHLPAFHWHKPVWQRFSDAREKDQLAHAIIIHGNEGIGRLALAQRMAKSLLCMTPVNGEACLECKACKTYDANANPDFKEITLLEDKQQIAVGQIRELNDFLGLSRSFAAYRVVLIHPAERMNINATNSLLKSLEEPADNTVLLLLTSRLDALLPTIKSRCQLYHVANPSYRMALKWLNKYQAKNNIELHNIDDQLSMSFNKPLKAVGITVDEAEDHAKLADEILDMLNEQHSITEMAKNWQKYNQTTMLNWQIAWIQKTIKNSVLEHNSDSYSGINTEMNQNLVKKIQSIFTLIATEQRWKLYFALLKQKQYIHTSVNPLMFVEDMILLWYRASKCQL